MKLIREFVGNDVRINLRGIRDCQFAFQLINAGADRLGVSNVKQ